MTPAAPDERSPLAQALFGRLAWDSVPFNEPILQATFVGTVLLGVFVLYQIHKAKAWGGLWRDWFCTIDHKKIGVMYMVLGIVMLIRGFADALMMRLHQAMAFGESLGYLPA